MLDIILCDDDKFILQLGAKRMEEEIAQKHYDARISCIAVESNAVLQYLKMNTGNYLIFLDLDLGNGKLNGIDVAKQIKRVCDTVKIVFVTNHQEMAMQVLSSGVEPFGFIEKTADMQLLRKSFGRYIQMAISAFLPEMRDREWIELSVGIDEIVRIDKQQIIYLEAEKTISHGISYHTMDGSCITVRDTLEHCWDRLGEDFIRVHRSILVNRKHIVSLSGTTLHLSNGEEKPCAIRMLKEVKRWLK
jgi:two-component system response regulator AgrA